MNDALVWLALSAAYAAIQPPVARCCMVITAADRSHRFGQLLTAHGLVARMRRRGDC